MRRAACARPDEGARQGRVHRRPRHAGGARQDDGRARREGRLHEEVRPLGIAGVPAEAEGERHVARLGQQLHHRREGRRLLGGGVPQVPLRREDRVAHEDDGCGRARDRLRRERPRHRREGHLRAAAAFRALQGSAAEGDRHRDRVVRRPGMESRVRRRRAQGQPAGQDHHGTARRRLRRGAPGRLGRHELASAMVARPGEEHPHVGTARAHGRVGRQAHRSLWTQLALSPGDDALRSHPAGQRQVEREDADLCEFRLEGGRARARPQRGAVTGQVRHRHPRGADDDLARRGLAPHAQGVAAREDVRRALRALLAGHRAGPHLSAP